MWDQDNYCSLCWACHTRKTEYEQELIPWEPISNRIVICGLPGVGKSTRAEQLARELNCDVFDWDEEGKRLGIDTRKDILESEQLRLMEVRKQWLIGHRGRSAIMIVTRPFSALRLASSMEGSVIHLVCDESTREKRLKYRQKAPR